MHGEESKQTNRNKTSKRRKNSLVQKNRAFVPKKLPSNGENKQTVGSISFFLASTTKKKLLFLGISEIFKLNIKKLWQNVLGTKQNTKEQAKLFWKENKQVGNKRLRLYKLCSCSQKRCLKFLKFVGCLICFFFLTLEKNKETNDKNCEHIWAWETLSKDF